LMLREHSQCISKQHYAALYQFCFFKDMFECSSAGNNNNDNNFEDEMKMWLKCDIIIVIIITFLD